MTGERQTPTVYTVEEAAELLRMSRATLYRLCNEEKVPHRRPPAGGIRFTATDIDKILADALREPAA